MEKKVIKNFSPSWFAVVMSTGIIPIDLCLAKSSVPFYSTLAKIFFVLSTLVFVALFIPWIIRFFTNMDEIKKDLRHPVLGSFFPTVAIATLILAIDFLRIGESFLGKELALKIALILFVIGTIGVFLFGFIILPLTYISDNINLQHANFGWFIPPVSHLIIAVVGLDLVPHYKNTVLGNNIFIISLIGAGIGMFLYLFVGAIVYHRYIYHEMPMPKLASTFFIGMSPTAILTIILVKLVAASKFVSYNINVGAISSVSKVLGIAFWGFSIWWFIISLIVLVHHIKSKQLPYALSWWAFIFPIGALGVSTGAINKLVHFKYFIYFLNGIDIVLLAMWLFIGIKTIKGIVNGTVFEAH
ncbi:hypothetical protein [Haliovirga abyssi]|uniref:Transporter n=1 Tax=Haliovirga abyssi TaxID=2996794 RepID=A0AAU9D2X8_9FUSO|nr:hypothetical protein [Haliovirga abyssi]BDU50359.1 transporter [Haliovirga abyssi]